MDSRKTVRKAMNLRMMDSAVRNMADENVLSSWRTYGIPDGSEGGDLLEFAENEDLYDEITRLFIRIVGNF